jgi:hypothetical protein
MNLLKQLPKAKNYIAGIENSNGLTIIIKEDIAQEIYDHAQINHLNIEFTMKSNGLCYMRFEQEHKFDREVIQENYKALQTEFSFLKKEE